MLHSCIPLFARVMVRVLHHLDDALEEIRESLLGLRRSRPVLIKIVNESGQEELHVFKIDTKEADNPAEEPPTRRGAVLSHPQPQPRQRVVVERRPPAPDDDVQRELRAQQERIWELESTLASTREDLRRALSGDTTPRSDALVDAVDSDSSPSAASSMVDGVSEDGASEADTGVSMLRLTDVVSTPDEDDGRSDEAAATSTSDSDVSDASSTGECNDDGESTSRRSDRQRKPVDRLCSSTQPAAITSGVKRKSASAMETTPSASTTKKIKHAGNNKSSNGDEGGDDCEEEIAALTTKLKEAYARRATIAMKSTSPSTVLQLVQLVFSNLTHPQAEAVTTDERQPPALGQWATHITNLITTSGAQKTLGYYLRSVLAHHLKHTTRQYRRLARDVLGIKSPNDIATYPAFFDFVQKYCPTIAAARLATGAVVTEAMVEEWLREPLFMADIGWGEWRRYLTQVVPAHHRGGRSTLSGLDRALQGLDATRLGGSVR